MTASVRIGTEVTIGRGHPLVVVCGPCVIESRGKTLEHAALIAEALLPLGVPWVFKSSYDKANRTSLAGYRGIGLEEGLQILKEVKERFSVPVVTDVHTAEEVRAAAAVVDLIQIPAFLCRQTDLLVAAAQTGKPVMVKKGQFLAPEDMEFVLQKARGTGGVVACERGSCFGYRELIVDMRGLQIMRQFGAPVVFDATHSVQVMGGKGGSSGGNRAFVASLARGAVAVGVDGVFLESHPDPDSAPSDGANMVPTAHLAALIRDLKTIHELALATRGESSV